MLYLAILGAILLILALGDYAISLFFYLLYLYDGGHKSFRWYRNMMNRTTIEW